MKARKRQHSAPGKTEAPGKPPSIGRKRKAKPAGKRMTRTQISAFMPIDFRTLGRNLALPDAPRPDEHMRWDYEDVRAWCLKVKTDGRHAAPTATKGSELREKLLEAELEAKAFDLGVKRGQFIERTQIKPAVTAFNTQLTDDLRAKFEFELPSKYAGKNLIECQQLNVAAIDYVLRRLKEGQAPVLPKEGAA